VEGDQRDQEAILRLLVSGCHTKAELAELAQSLGVRPRSSTTKSEIEAEILAVPARNERLAKEAERDGRTAEMRKLRDQTRLTIPARNERLAKEAERDGRTAEM
ncbi:uncharacterized protein METZ01_LOCUS415155, partial [marine metagenome]